MPVNVFRGSLSPDNNKPIIDQFMSAGASNPFTRLGLLACSLVAAPLPILSQGSLAPSGAPAPTMRTLAQIEPRTPIDSLPFVITQPGSYYLVTNLTDTLGTNGITVQANDVTIDLGGFTLAGSSGGPANRSGIFTGFATTTNLTVRNGTIRGWGFTGIRAQSAVGCQILNLNLSGNGINGVTLGTNGVIKECAANANGFYGIAAYDGSVVEACSVVDNGDLGIAGSKNVTVRGCSVRGSGSAGILVDDNSLVVDCTANTNGQTGFYRHGIYAGPHSTVSRCVAVGNASEGILAFDGCTIENWTVALNGTNGIKAGIGSTVRVCTARGNGDDGIEVPNDCLVAGNHCTGNGAGTGTGAGIHSTIAGNRIEGNSTIYNQRGLWIEGGANLVIRNSSRYNPNGTGTNNFVIASGNMVGPTNSLPFGTITNTSPWANFSY